MTTPSWAVAPTRLRYAYKMKHRNMGGSMGPCSGPEGRIKRMRLMVTALFRHERIESTWDKVDEARGYSERLIQEAIRHGDQHKHTMELADYWLMEKDLIHKMFKVFVPRYINYSSSFTQIHKLPITYPGDDRKWGLLELKENPWPPVIRKKRDFRNSLTNVLLEEARKDYRERKGRAEERELDFAGFNTDLAIEDMKDNMHELHIEGSTKDEGTPV